MRLLFFTYIAQSNETLANGNIWGKWESFPSNASLKEIAEERNPGLIAVITGWREFETEADFNAFTGTESTPKTKAM